MNEYNNGGSTAQEQYFGPKICPARMVIECPFGRLKVHFGKICCSMDIKIKDLPFVIYSAFVIHNFCELHGESVTEEDVTRSIEHDQQFQPTPLPCSD